MSAYPAYNYDSLARELDYPSTRCANHRESVANPERAGRRFGKIEVVAGGAKGLRASGKPKASPALLAARIIVAAIIAFSGIGFLRVTFSSLTVAEALEAHNISSQLDFARSEISDLEVKQSTLTNPSRIKAEAEGLNMARPASTLMLDISGDVVVADDSGTLLLSDSLEALAEAHPRAAENRSGSSDPDDAGQLEASGQSDTANGKRANPA